MLLAFLKYHCLDVCHISWNMTITEFWDLCRLFKFLLLNMHTKYLETRNYLKKLQVKILLVSSEHM